jgi:predicted ATPase
MKYRYSRVDEENLKWFENDVTCATLSAVELRKGEIRGLNGLKIQLTYPISAFAGANGSGKSTILALAACAFHNVKQGFRLPGRLVPYYTMSDFLVQSEDEVPLEGINIWYKILHNGWKKSPRLPTGIGPGWQSRSKNKGGKWSHYSRRVDRNVVFFGIERVVPHSERSVSKSYRHHFQRAVLAGSEEAVQEIVGRILGRKYEDFWFRQFTKYRLPHVKTKGTVYSGFNMGAVENALFEIFSTIFAAPEGLLVVVDELELGLHDSAQRRFVKELKTICRDRHVQIICTTHSPTVLSCLPPEGRFFLERRAKDTTVTEGVSPDYAAGRLAEQNSQELDVFVEDGIAENMVRSILPVETRRRVNILPVGSAEAVVRQMAARFKERNRGDCVALLDGDQRTRRVKLLKHFLKMLEINRNEKEEQAWFEQRLDFLPGNLWPESWVFEKLVELNLNSLTNKMAISRVELFSLCENALNAGKKQEFHTLAKGLSLPTEEVCGIVCRWLATAARSDFQNSLVLISSHLI